MPEIYNIIDKKKLDVVKKPINKAHGLPNECYISKEYTLIERKKLFEDKWVVIGVASSLLNVGDAKTFNLLGIPLLILRNKKNKIKVFHNICSHRGVKLVRKSGKIKNVIRCPHLQPTFLHYIRRTRWLDSYSDVMKESGLKVSHQYLTYGAAAILTGTK